MRKYELTISNKSFTIAVKSFSSDAAELEVNGKIYTVRVDQVVTEAGGAPEPVRRAAATGASTVRTGAPRGPAPAKAAAAGGAGSVTAPIPGLILEIFVKEGDKVEAGQPVLKMEAMKMENVISASIAGTVASIRVNSGESVAQGQELLIIG